MQYSLPKFVFVKPFLPLDRSPTCFEDVSLYLRFLTAKEHICASWKLSDHISGLAYLEPAIFHSSLKYFC